MKKIEFETFKDVGSGYYINQMKSEVPSNINFLSYRKYKVTIEIVDEPKEVLIKRLESLIKIGNGYYKNDRIRKEIKLILKDR